MITDPNRCIVCGAQLVTEREACRCEPCQSAGRWTPDVSCVPVLPATPALVARHHLRPGWRATTHTDGLAMLGLAEVAP